MFLECLVLHEGIIRPEAITKNSEEQTECAWKKYELRKHHQSAGFLVDVLAWPLPLFPDPFLIEEQLVEVIGHRSG